MNTITRNTGNDKGESASTLSIPMKHATVSAFLSLSHCTIRRDPHTGWWAILSTEDAAILDALPDGATVTRNAQGWKQITHPDQHRDQRRGRAA